ncbi:lysophospholipid acyltransferase family protein [Halonatronum saccharophilum]|uniref:lysophospholipid acyltransferase family protein n=1 Tax=Halonatronum saccharophilum TaxID=150060 RepID=UPI0004B3B02E|nr:lysophospholipid acyltransferase family protein [Halonatronum saccharophilum]
MLKKIMQRISYTFFKLFKGVVNLLPERLAYYFAKLLGFILFYLVKSRRDLAIKNIRLSFGYSLKDARSLTRKVFQDVVIKTIETIRFENWSERCFDDKIEVEGMKYLKRAYEEDRGVILFTGHIGNWELLGLYLSWLGYPINAIAKKHRNPLMYKEIINIRESNGGNVFANDKKGVKQAFRALLKKELLLILGDQDARSKGEFVRFLDRPASTPTGPVVFAQKTGALILPVYLMRLGYGKYKLIIEEAIGVDKKADKEEIKEKLQKLTSSLETKVKEYPDQWLWLHRRWKTKIKGASK